MVTQVDLFRLIFEEILKISPDLLYKYTTLQGQILHLIFFPHVILFLFLFGFGMMLMREQRGLRYLIVIAAYIFIVYQGWYGTFLIPLLETWFYIMLIFGLFVFLVTKIFPPAVAQRMGQFTGKVGGSVGERMGRGKEIEELEEELKFVRKRLKKLEGVRHANPAAAYEYESYKKQEKELKKAIKKLGG